MNVAAFRKLPLLGIIRGVESSQIKPLIEVVISTGLKTVEITMNTKNAPQLIRQAVKQSRGRLTIGAGTVLSVDCLKEALDNGATFAVMPVLAKDVMRYCLRHKIPAFPGALTPQEIYTAWQEGATMVKVFPAGCFGPGYFKEIKGPFDDIELVAVGGVTPRNLPLYFKNGASAVAIGSSVFKPEWLKARKFRSIASFIKQYLDKLP